MVFLKSVFLKSAYRAAPCLPKVDPGRQSFGANGSPTAGPFSLSTLRTLASAGEEPSPATALMTMIPARANTVPPRATAFLPWNGGRSMGALAGVNATAGVGEAVGAAVSVAPVGAAEVRPPAEDALDREMAVGDVATPGPGADGDGDEPD